MEQFDLLRLPVIRIPPDDSIQCSVVAADDLLAGRLPAGFVVTDTVSCHIHAHVGGRFVRTFAVDLPEDRVQDREDLHIPVIVDCCLAVSFQVERIDHIDIV